MSSSGRCDEVSCWGNLVIRWNTNWIKYFFPEVTEHKSERCPPNGTVNEKHRVILLHTILVPCISEFTLAASLIWDSGAYNCQKLVTSPQCLELSDAATYFFSMLYSLPWQRFSRVIACQYQSVGRRKSLFSQLKMSLSQDKSGLLFQIVKRSPHNNSNVTQTNRSINNRISTEEQHPI